MAQFFRTLLALALAALTVSASLAQENTSSYSIENVKGDLYRIHGDGRSGVFLVTNQCVMLVNPISSGTASWLKDELKSRFGAEVKLVLYTHADPNYISGGAVFEDTAIFAANVLSRNRISEFKEIFPPDHVFHPFSKFVLGTSEIYALYIGPSRSLDFSVFWFPGERAVYVADLAAAKRLPGGDLNGFYFPSSLEVLRRINLIDFEILIPSGGNIGTKADLTAFNGYLTDLFEQVNSALSEGHEIEGLLSRVNLSRFSEWEGYPEWKEQNIIGMARILKDPRLSSLYALPKKIERPGYPYLGSKKKISAWVLLMFDVDEKGVPFNVKVLDSDVSKEISYPRVKPLFEANAVRALTKSRYDVDGPAYDQIYRYVFSANPRDDPFFRYQDWFSNPQDLPRSIFQFNAVPDPR